MYGEFEKKFCNLILFYILSMISNKSHVSHVYNSKFKTKNKKVIVLLVIAQQHVPIFESKQHFAFSTFNHSTVFFLAKGRQDGFSV